MRYLKENEMKKKRSNLKGAIMKRWLVFSMMLVLIGSMFALESDPSEVVGYVKIDSPVGYTIFSNPFTYYDATHTPTLDLDDVIGTQLTGGTPANADRIYDANLGSYAFLSAAGVWTGSLVNFTLTHANYAKIYNTANSFYLAGTVEDEIMNFGTMAVGYNVVGLKVAGAVPMSDLDLISSGFTGGTPATSDRIYDANTGQYAFYNSGTSTWAGTLTQTTIGHSYYILVKNTAFSWTYDPTGSDDTGRGGNYHNSRIKGDRK
jgi:hypothetical protein